MGLSNSAAMGFLFGWGVLAMFCDTAEHAVGAVVTAVERVEL